MATSPDSRPAVAKQLERCGWTVTHEPREGQPPYQWRSPTGVAGPEFRCDSPDDPPPAVVEYAVRNGSLTGG